MITLNFPPEKPNIPTVYKYDELAQLPEGTVVKCVQLEGLRIITDSRKNHIYTGRGKIQGIDINSWKYNTFVNANEDVTITFTPNGK